jgi:hypothetical protein
VYVSLGTLFLSLFGKRENHKNKRRTEIMKLHISHVLTLSDEALAGIGCTKEYLREYLLRHQAQLSKDICDLMYLEQTLPDAHPDRQAVLLSRQEAFDLSEAVRARINTLPAPPERRPTRLTRAAIRHLVQEQESKANGTSHGN